MIGESIITTFGAIIVLLPIKIRLDLATMEVPFKPQLFPMIIWAELCASEDDMRNIVTYLNICYSRL